MPGKKKKGEKGTEGVICVSERKKERKGKESQPDQSPMVGSPCTKGERKKEKKKKKKNRSGFVCPIPGGERKEGGKGGGSKE